MSPIKEVTSASSNGKYKVARVQVEPAKEEQVFTLLISLAIILIQNVTGDSLQRNLKCILFLKRTLQRRIVILRILRPKQVKRS